MTGRWLVLLAGSGQSDRHRPGPAQRPRRLFRPPARQSPPRLRTARTACTPAPRRPAGIFRHAVASTVWRGARAGARGVQPCSDAARMPPARAPLRPRPCRPPKPAPPGRPRRRHSPQPRRLFTLLKHLRPSPLFTDTAPLAARFSRPSPSPPSAAVLPPPPRRPAARGGALARGGCSAALCPQGAALPPAAAGGCRSPGGKGGQEQQVRPPSKTHQK